MPIYLSIKEMTRNWGRFLLFSLVIALITTLVLFTNALADGLGLGNKEYIEKLNADLIVFKQGVDLSIGASRIDRNSLNEIRRVPGVKDVGTLSFTNVSVQFDANQKPLNVAMIGVEPGRPGEPPVVQGRPLSTSRAREAIIDRNVALRTGLKLGVPFKIKVIQGSKEQYFDMVVSGISDGRQYFLQPSIIVPYLAFDEIKPGAGGTSNDFIANVVAVQLSDPATLPAMRMALMDQVPNTQVATRKEAYEAAPGYAAQQSTLGTQTAFVLIIGVLVIGGFFQIQTLQKVPQIGMLKAIGASNTTVGLAAIAQIIVVTIVGVTIGAVGTLLLSLTFPATIPILFSANAVLFSVLALTLIGPIGGLVSVRYSLQVEPLTALGLAQ
ncbi:MAG: ABC transporter permease [Chloroflexi bacterium]|nr:ABC transporter permease [Chloroflexota bacterium]